MKKKLILIILWLNLVFTLSYNQQKCENETTWLNPDLPIDVRITELMSVLTIDEKIGLLSETSDEIERLGIPAYNYGNEALHGLVRPGKATVFPQAIALGATFNPELIKLMTTYISDEARAKYNASNGELDLIRASGTLTAWSPTINMARDPRWGRTAETYGEDPFLSGKLGTAFVEGLQGDDPNHIKMAAAPKHFVANNEDDNRFSCKAEIPERWLHDYYLNAFRNVVTKAKPLSVMSSYNAINGVPCTANQWLLTDLLRDTWGFNGFVVSDCGAISNLYDKHQYVNSLEEAVASAMRAGCDLECGGWCTYPYVYLNYAKSALEKGFIEESVLDTAVYRVLRGRILLGMLDPISEGPYSSIEPEVIGCEKHQELAREISRQSIVLLKNEDLNGAKLLPINSDKVKNIAVVGPNADVLQFGDYSGVPINEAITPLQGIQQRAGENIKVNPVVWINQSSGSYPIPKEYFYIERNRSVKGLKAEYFQNTNLDGNPSVVRTDEQINFEWTNQPPDPDVGVGEFSVRWTGHLKADITGMYHFNLDVSDGVRFYLDDKLLIDHWSEKNLKPITEDGKSKLWDIKYFLNQRADTTSLWLEKGEVYSVKVEFFHKTGNAKAYFNWEVPQIPKEELFQAEKKAAAKNDLIIAVLGLGEHIEKEGKDKKNINLPESQLELIRELQKINKNIVIVLINGSPVNVSEFAKNQPAIVEAWYPGEQGGNAIADILFGDYCPGGKLPITFYADDSQLPPMDDYDISKGRTYIFLKEQPSFVFGHGLSYTTFDYKDLAVEQNIVKEKKNINAEFTITNSGIYNGDEVTQVYVKHLNSNYIQPIKQLKGFKRTHLLAHQSKKIQIDISVEELQFWDESKNKFIFEAGDYEILVGSSSEDIRLRSTISIR